MTENRLRASVVSFVGEGTESLSAAVLMRWFWAWSNQTWRVCVDWRRSLHVWSDLSTEVEWESRESGCALTIPRRMTSIVSSFRRIRRRISRGIVVNVDICEKLGLTAVRQVREATASDISNRYWCDVRHVAPHLVDRKRAFLERVEVWARDKPHDGRLS